MREKRTLVEVSTVRQLTPRGLLLLVTVLAQTLLALVSGNLMTLSFFTAGHVVMS